MIQITWESYRAKIQTAIIALFRASGRPEVVNDSSTVVRGRFCKQTLPLIQVARVTDS